MTKQWFVLQTLTGQEFKVKRSIEARVRIEEMSSYIGDVEVPTEKVTEIKNGVKTTVTRKFFPGYILAHLALYDESNNYLEPTWRFIKETSGVLGFIGGARPRPLSAKEVDDIFKRGEEGAEAEARPQVDFSAGDVIRVKDGPFSNFEGVVDTVDPDRGTLTISVSIFGRVAPVELEYWQVEHAPVDS